MAKASPNYDFLITDPEKQPGVVLEVEAGSRPVQLLEPYSADHDVHCAFCPQKQLHRHGYLALLEDGRRALCGNICAEEYFDKSTVNSLDRKRDQLTNARQKRRTAEALIGNAASLLPVIDDEISHNEWAAEAAMLQLGQYLPSAVKQKIVGSSVEGVKYLGQACRAFGDARGGIAAIVQKADGVTEREAEKLMEKRSAVTKRIEYGTEYLQEAVSFFEQENLRRFRHWLLDYPNLHDIKQVQITNQCIMLSIHTGTNWMGDAHVERYEAEIPKLEAPDLETLMKLLGWQR